MKQFFLLIITILGLHVSAQDKCHSVQVTQKLRENDPVYDREIREMEQRMLKQITNGQFHRDYSDRGLITIPVVVHVVWNTAAENVSDAVINQMINQLNADYRKLNSDFNTVRSAVQPSAGDAQLNFCLASVNPQGQPTNGIVRVQSAEACFDPNTETNKMKSTSTGGSSPWNPTQYMNIWVCDLCGSGSLQTAGYAYLPTPGMHGSNIDGLVVDCSIGLGNGNRTATHEIGHYLGLHHTWGDLSGNACGNVFPNTDDGFGDTPDSAEPIFFCNGTINTCTGGPSYGDQYENFMDYSDCTAMFSNEQCAYMNNVLSSTRSSLLNSTACTTIGGPTAQFTASATTICAGQSVTFTNQSTGSGNTYSWSFAGGTPASSTQTNPTITYASAGTYGVTLTATNTNGSDNEVKTAYINVVSATASALPLQQGFEATTFVPTGWTASNPDNLTFWQRTTSASGFGTSTASALFDNYNSDNAGQRDWLITPSYNFNGVANGRIRWEYAYTYYTGSAGTLTDSLEILYSTNCGASWTSLWKRGGAALATGPASANLFTPTAAQWRRDSVSLSALNGQSNVRFAFVNVNGYGNSLILDNINIFNASSGGVQAPVTDFIGTPTTVNVGNTVAFTDLSTNSPTSWSWNFGGGGTPNTSTQQNPVITWNTAGTYNVTLTATNSGGSTPVTKNAYITVINPGGGSTSCDTVANFLSTDTAVTYIAPGTIGYLSGHNGFGDLAKADFFTNTTPGAQITGVFLNFSIAKVSGTGNVNVCVWDASGTGGSPGAAPLVSVPLNISTIIATGINGPFQYVSFPTPPTVNGNYYVGIQLIYASGDTVALRTTTVSNPATGQGWEQYSDGTWHTYLESYNVDLTNFIAPVICTSSTVAAPVANFSAGSTSVCRNSSVSFSSTSTGSISSYSWNFPGGSPAVSSAQNPVVSYATPGTYSVTLTVSGPGGNNTKTTNSYITVYDNPTATASSTAVSCFGQSTGSATVAVSGGTTPYSYSWSGGGNTATIQNKPSGTYTVTVTDNRQCSATATVNISQPFNGITVNAQANDAVCNKAVGSATVSANGGNGGFSYSWSNGQTGQSIVNLFPGTYQVTVIDAAGCTATGSVIVQNQNSNFAVTANTSPANCGEANGTATASTNSGSIGGVTYLWSNGATSGSISGLSPGIYTVTATDDIGCTASTSATVNSSSSLVVGISSSNPSTAQSSNGSATANPNGGTPPYTYQWSNGGNQQTIQNLGEGNYSVTVTDAAGCVFIQTVTLSAPTVGVDDLSEFVAVFLYPNPAKDIINLKMDMPFVQLFSITVHNSLGQEMESRSGESSALTTTFRTNAWSDGVYFFRVQVNGKSSVYRFVVQK